VHAGHGLNLSNLTDICKITQIEELNIGHAIVADSIFKGFKKTIMEYRSAIDNG
jgi:pyridoxine 5-phosphate synthase